MFRAPCAVIIIFKNIEFNSLKMDLEVDDFVWENYDSWNGSDDACYSKLNMWIRQVVKKYPRSKLSSYARKKEQEQIFVRDKLVAMKRRSHAECQQDSFNKFIGQRNRLRHLYMIISTYAYVSTDIIL